MSLQAIEPELVVATAGSGGSGGGFAATLSADDVAVNRFLLDLIRCVRVGVQRMLAAPSPPSNRRCIIACTASPPYSLAYSLAPLLPPCLPGCGRVGENNGIRFPREFALLIKQVGGIAGAGLMGGGGGRAATFPPMCRHAAVLLQILYFDRYNRILAPALRVFDDSRINLQQQQQQQPGGRRQQQQGGFVDV